MRSYTPYHVARPRIQSGDMLVFNNPDGLIARVGRGDASHIGMAVWRHDDQDSLSVVESREWVGGRIVSLSSQIRKYPRAIDVWRPNGCPDRLRRRMATVAYNWAGHGYGYPGIARLAIVHSPALRAALALAGYDPDMTDTTPTPWDLSKFCSQLYTWAPRWSARELPTVEPWDPCPGLGDAWVEPSDLVRAALAGRFRIVAKGLVIDE